MTFVKSDEKLQILETYLENDQFLLIHLNPSANDVIVPENFRSSATLTLKISYHFQGLVKLNATKLTAELLFNGNMFECSIPLSAIWGCTTMSQKNYIWPESLSGDSYSNLASEIESIQKPKLAVNKTSTSNTKADQILNPEKAPAENKKTRPQLTRIK